MRWRECAVEIASDVWDGVSTADDKMVESLENTGAQRGEARMRDIDTDEVDVDLAVQADVEAVRRE